MAARTVTYNGVTLTISQWAKRNNLSSQVVRNRLDAGWPIEKALFQPPHKFGRPSMERAMQIRTTKLRREFSKLVFDVDNALRSFREKLDALLPDEQTPGVVEEQPNERPDRTIPSAQDSV